MIELQCISFFNFKKKVFKFDLEKLILELVKCSSTTFNIVNYNGLASKRVRN